jgi:2-methylcitrate dehydratase PrpD
MDATPRALTADIAAFAAGLSLDAIPTPVRAKVKLHIVDGLGCGIAAAGSDIVAGVLRFLGLEQRAGECPVLGERHRFGPAAAAFANAAAINALDFDDGFEVAGRGMGHPGATILAAAAAAPFLTHVSGAALLVGVTAAYEANNRLIRAMQPSPERFGQVYGVCQHQSVAAAIAYGKLLGLAAPALENAIGFAGTLCSVPSLRKYNWQRRPLASLKDFAAPAAEAGVRGVQLHACGLVGARDVLDGADGLWRMLGSDRFDAASLVAGLGRQWTLDNTSFKAFPVCRWMHTALEAFAALRSRHGFSAEQIDTVTVHTSAALARDLMELAPETMVDAQFSIPYALAALALGIPIGAAWYRQETLQRADVRAFARRVAAEIDPQIDALMRGERRPAARVTIRARGNTYPSERCDFPLGSRENPIAEAAIAEKFRANAAPVIGPANAKAMLAHIAALETLKDTRALLALALPPEGGGAPPGGVNPTSEGRVDG